MNSSVKKSKIKLDSIFKSFPDIVYIIDSKGFFLDVNDIACKIFGYNRSDILGKSIDQLDFLTSDSKIQLLKNLKQRLKGKKVSPYILETVDKDGKPLFLEINANLIKKDEITYEIGIARQVTAQKLSMAKRRESEIRFRLLSESLPVGIFLTDKEGRIKYTNTAWKKIIEVSSEKLKIPRWEVLIHPDEREKILQKWTKSKYELKSFCEEFRIFTAKRNIKWIRFRSSTMISDEGIFYPGSIEDITDRKKVEKALSNSEAKYRAIFETSGTPMIIFEDSRKITLANKEFEKLSGLKRDVIENKLLWTDFIVGKNKDNIQIYSRLMRRKKINKPKLFVTKFRDKLNKEKGVILTFSLIPNSNKSVASIVDITERIEAEKNLSRSIRELQKLDHMKSDFLSMVSHEFRTPLAVIQGSVDFLKRHSKLNEKSLNTLQTISNESDHLNSIINKILQVSRIQGGKISLNKEIFDLTQLIKDIYLEWRDICKKDHNLIFEKTSKIEINADKTLIRTVLSNLVSNSHKYTPEGGKIKLNILDKSNHVEFSIEDNGVGISKSDQQYLFDLFYLADKGITREADRMGVGLYTAKSIIELHKGILWVESKKGEGSTFYFSLPK